MNASCLKK